ncbi:MAG: hypothetical protein R3190_07770 [Thermoanaerobaculia bacterium]|nr:hypothetical protein [Thermoanaerobaculia bacterium]
MRHRITAALGIGILAVVMSGCPEEKGPLEKAGAKLDDATEDAHDALEEAASDAGRAIEDATEELDQ